MSPITGTVTLEYHGSSAHYPSGVSVGISALGEIDGFALSVCSQEGHITYTPSCSTDIVGQKPLAVGTPGKILVTIAIAVGVLAVHYHMGLSIFQVHHLDGGTVFQISYLFAVGAVYGLEGSGFPIGKSALHSLGTIGERLLFLVLDFAFIYSPDAIPFRIVDHGFTIRTEAHGTFPLGCIGHLPSGLMFHIGHIHITIQDKSHLLAVG